MKLKNYSMTGNSRKGTCTTAYCTNGWFSGFCGLHKLHLGLIENHNLLYCAPLVNNQPNSSSGSVIFDERNASGDALRRGIYIIFLEAINEGKGVVETMKKVVVVARKL